jgi:hypothetical protein
MTPFPRSLEKACDLSLGQKVLWAGIDGILGLGLGNHTLYYPKCPLAVTRFFYISAKML